MKIDDANIANNARGGCARKKLIEFHLAFRMKAQSSFFVVYRTLGGGGDEFVLEVEHETNALDH